MAYEWNRDNISLFVRHPSVADVTANVWRDRHKWRWAIFDGRGNTLATALNASESGAQKTAELFLADITAADVGA